MEGLRQLALERHILLVLIYHTRKAVADDPIDEVQGTSGVTAAIDDLWALRRRKAGDTFTMFYTKGRNGSILSNGRWSSGHSSIPRARREAVVDTGSVSAKSSRWCLRDGSAGCSMCCVRRIRARYRRRKSRVRSVKRKVKVRMNTSLRISITPLHQLVEKSKVKTDRAAVGTRHPTFWATEESVRGLPATIAGCWRRYGIDVEPPPPD